MALFSAKCKRSFQEVHSSPRVTVPEGMVMEDDLSSGISCQQLPVNNDFPCTELWGWPGGGDEAERRKKEEKKVGGRVEGKKLRKNIG